MGFQLAAAISGRRMGRRYRRIMRGMPYRPRLSAVLLPGLTNQPQHIDGAQLVPEGAVFHIWLEGGKKAVDRPRREVRKQVETLVGDRLPAVRGEDLQHLAGPETILAGCTIARRVFEQLANQMVAIR